MKTKAPIAATVMAIVLASISLWNPRPVSAASSTLQVMPNSIRITESFRGAPLTISADIPQGDAAVVEIKGDTLDAHLLRKGRRGGLWMNVGEIEVRGAPSLYLVMSTDPDIPAASGKDAQWGYDALQKEVAFAGALPKEGAPLLFEQLVRLKESEGLYGVFPGSLTMGTGSGQARVEGHFVLPSNLAAGTYRISLSVLSKGKVLEQRSVELPVEMAGLTAFLESLAHQHAMLYGLLAVVIAIATGFAMGFVFKGKGAH